jgi:hypothetical protein
LIVLATSALYGAGTAVMVLATPPWNWLGVVPLALLAAGVCRLVEWPGQRRASLRADGRCERCAYDLRATPHRCPECGRTTW